MNVSRRFFLKVFAGSAVASLAWSNVSNSAPIEGNLATLIDLSLCDGCVNLRLPACVQACREINKNRVPPVKEPIPEPWPRKTIEDWSKKKDVFDRLTPYNFLYIHRAELIVGGEKKTFFIPRRCMHCDNPACATICPFSANHKFKNGAVVIDEGLCFGGAKCRDVCPWNIPQRQSGVGIYLHILPSFMGNGVMYKCDLCHERLGKGKLPACIEICPRRAMIIGKRKEIEEMAERRRREMNGFIYGKVENGGTSTLYVSPVSFELLNKTMKKSPGKPDMVPGIKRRMEITDPLGKVVLFSPLVGAVVGIAAGWKRRKEEKND
ncbi:MAG: 4Fe-4S dicluster domain-containing protein [Syntrophales bacterium]|nr:4Fe-4S dicluster domain-containing protein [Syntrophales bacterium]